MNKTLSVLMSVFLFSLQGPAIAEEQAGLKHFNKVKEDVIVTESGLQYRVLIMGKGRKPGPNNKVNVHYRGLFLDGVVFETSFTEDEPMEIKLKKVIKGWREGIQLMPVGSVFLFLIPPELAYGDKGSSLIPPNTPLIFEVELFGIR